jgi:hypothetical protein
MDEATFFRLAKLLIMAALALGPIAAIAQDSGTPTNPMGKLEGAAAYHSKLFSNQSYVDPSSPSNASNPYTGAEVYGAKIRGESTVVRGASGGAGTE